MSSTILSGKLSYNTIQRFMGNDITKFCKDDNNRLVTIDLIVEKDEDIPDLIYSHYSVKTLQNNGYVRINNFYDNGLIDERYKYQGKIEGENI